MFWCVNFLTVQNRRVGSLRVADMATKIPEMKDNGQFRALVTELGYPNS